MSIGPSTYLNGLSFDLLCGCDQCQREQEEPARPRFMTAWMHGGEGMFTPTGDAFMTLDAAEKFARTTLENDGQEGQLAVFEIRSVHLARLDITSERA